MSSGGLGSVAPALAGAATGLALDGPMGASLGALTGAMGGVNGLPPGMLPNLGINPQFYDPNSFSAPQLTGGSYNRMAQRLAGPVYNPVLLYAQAGGGRLMSPPGAGRVTQ